MPANAGEFTLTLDSDREVSVYIRKGSNALPDTVTFDSLVKDETQISISSKMMNFEKGGIFAVHCVGETDDKTTFKVELNLLENVMVRNSYEFLDLAATPTPSAAAPRPAFERGRDGDMSGDLEPKGDALLSNLQFMIIGAFLGIIATIVYYQMARCYQ